jgi:hypothetical protein
MTFERINLVTGEQRIFHACLTHIRVHSAGLLSFATWCAPHIESVTIPVMVCCLEDWISFVSPDLSFGICICAAASSEERQAL